MKQEYLLEKGLRFVGLACVVGSLLLAIPAGLQACGVCEGTFGGTTYGVPNNGCPTSPGTNNCGGEECINCSFGSTCRCKGSFTTPGACGCGL